VKNLRNVALILLCGVYTLFWTGGVFTHAMFGGPPSNATWAAPFFLLVAGFLVLLSSDGVTCARLVLAGAVGLAAEGVGVHFGYPFGGYEYTDVLAPRLLGVPIVMACAWFVLVAFVRQLLLTFAMPRVAFILVSAVVLTSFDLVIDPLAAGPLDYWRWDTKGLYYGIPASNFAGWLLVSVAVMSAAGVARTRNRVHEATGITIVAFFTLLSLVYAQWLVTIIGVALLIGCALMIRSNKRQAVQPKPAS